MGLFFNPGHHTGFSYCISYYYLQMNGHRSSSNSPDDLPLPVAIHTRSHQFPFDSCWNVCVLHHLPQNTNLIPATILNLPTNSFCLLDTALVLISDNFFFKFPSIHSSRNPLVTPFKNSVVMAFLLCVHVHSLSSD